MTRTSGKLRRGIWGVVAAYLIVLQTALTGLAVGSQPVAADPFSVLCAPGDERGASAPDKTHKAAPDCCVAGCQMFGGGLGAPPAEEEAAGEAAARLDVRPPARTAVLALSPDPSPRTTRGPPATV